MAAEEVDEEVDEEVNEQVDEEVDEQVMQTRWKWCIGDRKGREGRNKSLSVCQVNLD